MNNANKVFIKKSLLIIFISLIINKTFTAKSTSSLSETKEYVCFDAKNAGRPMKKTVHNVKDDLTSGAHEIKEDVKETTHNVKDDIKILAHDVKESIKDTAHNAKENVKQKLTNIKEGLEEKAHDFNVAIKDKLSNVKEQVQEKAQVSKENITLGAKIAEQTIKEKAHDLGEKTKEVTSGIKKNVEEKAESAKQNFNQTMGTVQKKVHDAKDSAQQYFIDQKKHDNSSTDKIRLNLVDGTENKKDFKKKIKTILKAAKNRRSALITKLTDDLTNYEILLEKLISEGLSKEAIEKDHTILLLKNAIETTEYEIAFLQEKYNKIWAKAYPNLAKLVNGLKRRTTFK